MALDKFDILGSGSNLSHCTTIRNKGLRFNCHNTSSTVLMNLLAILKHQSFFAKSYYAVRRRTIPKKIVVLRSARNLSHCSIKGNIGLRFNCYDASSIVFMNLLAVLKRQSFFAKSCCAVRRRTIPDKLVILGSASNLPHFTTIRNTELRFKRYNVSNDVLVNQQTW